MSRTTPDTRPPRFRRSAGLALLVAAATCAAFIVVLRNGFLSWDDGYNFLENVRYRGLGWDQLKWMWGTFLGGHYIPLTWMTLGLDYVVWGMNPLGYHLTNLLWHAANAVLVYFLALLLLKYALPETELSDRETAAFFAALLFSLHPTRVESVAWVTERRGLLSGFFFLSALLAYGRYVEVTGRRRWGWYGGALLLFVAALLGKAVTLVLPAVLLILDFYPLRRLRSPRSLFPILVFEKLPFAVMSLAAGYGLVLATAWWGGLGSSEGRAFSVRAAQVLYGVFFHSWKFVWPVNLSPIYEFPPGFDWATRSVALYAAWAVSASVAAFVARKRVPALPAVWLYFLAVLSPSLGVAVGPSMTHDRYGYLPSLGWVFLAGGGFLWFLRRYGGRPRLRYAALGAGILVVVLFSVLSFRQAQIWRTNETLWTHALSVFPDSAFAHENLGTVRLGQGKYQEALTHYAEALKIFPFFPEIHNNIGITFLSLDRPAAAAKHFRLALLRKPRHAVIRTNLGYALSREGKIAEALHEYRTALQSDPENVQAHYNLSCALMDLGRLEEALGEAQETVRLSPSFAKAHYTLANLYVKLSRLPEAVERYRETLRHDPRHTDARFNLAGLLYLSGRPLEAAAEYQTLLKINPNDRDARTKLRLILDQNHGNPAR